MATEYTQLSSLASRHGVKRIGHISRQDHFIWPDLHRYSRFQKELKFLDQSSTINQLRHCPTSSMLDILLVQSSVQSPKRHNGIRKTLRNRSQQGCSSTGSIASAKSRVASEHGSRSSGPQGCSPSSSCSRVAGGHDSRAACLADAVGDRASKGWSGDEEYWDESRETHVELDGRWMDLSSGEAEAEAELG